MCDSVDHTLYWTLLNFMHTFLIPTIRSSQNHEIFRYEILDSIIYNIYYDMNRNCSVSVLPVVELIISEVETGYKLCTSVL